MAKYDFFIVPGKEEKPQYTARIVHEGEMDIDKIARQAAYYNRMPRATILAAWTNIAEIIREALKEGKRIHLNGIGYLSLSATSEKVDNPKVLRAESIRYKGINLRTDKECDQAMCITKFERTHVKHTRPVSDADLLTFLKEHFKNNPYITRKKLAASCGLSYITANRKLKQFVEEGILTHPGPRNSSFYFLHKAYAGIPETDEENQGNLPE